MNYPKSTALTSNLNSHILVITLNRPEVSNAINYEMIEALVNTLAVADQDELVRAVILTGEGKNFCSGGDLKNMLEKADMFAGASDELRKRYEFGIQKISRQMDSFTKPLIAAVNGAAAGAGCDLACMCDIRIAADDAKFLENFVKVGLVPGDGGSFFLQRVIGFSKAMEMTLTGRTVDANEALQIGLVNRVISPGKLLESTLETARQICENAPIAVQMSKKALKVAYQSNLNTVLDLLSAYQGIAQRSVDHEEALNSISQKRKPSFIGK